MSHAERRYVHRVGRTARMGQAGEAVLFLLPSEAPYLPLLGSHGVRLAPLPLDPVLEPLPDLENASVRGCMKYSDTTLIFVLNGECVLPFLLTLC